MREAVPIPTGTIPTSIIPTSTIPTFQRSTDVLKFVAVSDLLQHRR